MGQYRHSILEFLQIFFFFFNVPALIHKHLSGLTRKINRVLVITQALSLLRTHWCKTRDHSHHQSYLPRTKPRKFQTYIIPEHAGQEGHHDAVFPRVFLAQSTDSLHYHYLQNKRRILVTHLSFCEGTGFSWSQTVILTDYILVQEGWNLVMDSQQECINNSTSTCCKNWLC